jgi:YVTN family beta-propeller protein
VINVASNAVLRTITVGGEVLRIAVRGADGFIFASTTDGRLLRISPVDDGLTTLSVGGTLNGLEINESRSVLYVSSNEGTLTEVDLGTFTVSRSRALGGFPQGIAISPSGETIWVANEGTGLQRLDATSFMVTEQTAMYAGAFDVLVTPDGEHVYVTRYWSSDISVMAAATGAHLMTIPASGPRRMAISLDGSTVMVAEEGGIVRFIR